MIDTLLLDGGIGDCLKVLSHVIPKKVIYAGGDRGKIIGTLCRQLDIEFTHLFCANKVFYYKYEAEAVFGRIDAVDGSLYVFFPRILSGEFPFLGNPFLRLSLPRLVEDDYVLCVPASENGINRNFNSNEIMNAIESTSKKVVMMHKGHFRVPAHPRVKNLMNATSILEAIGLVKWASNYIGVDSWASCLFSEMGRGMVVKSVSPNFYRWFEVYMSNEFGMDHIQAVPKIEKMEPLPEVENNGWWVSGEHLEWV